MRFVLYLCIVLITSSDFVTLVLNPVNSSVLVVQDPDNELYKKSLEVAAKVSIFYQRY